MNENLEDFIRKNRSAFDDKEPSGRLWPRIESTIRFATKKTTLWNSVVLWRAAAILLFGVCIFLIAPKGETRKQQSALNEFNDVERFYIQQISEKTDIIRDHFKMDGFNGFTNDFKQLEAMYQVLKAEMETSPSQKVKDALVLNLLVRIDLLNQQLQKLENKEEHGEDPETKEESPKEESKLSNT
jgi:hypothetical protein